LSPLPGPPAGDDGDQFVAAVYEPLLFVVDHV
jgi:hypothetical protein